jgi:dipeptidyl aminopeptidase/acylaminoacyl peptidase
LQRAGKPVRLIELEDAGHSGWSSGNETAVLTEMETFLRQHLPPAAPLPAEAQPASR